MIKINNLSFKYPGTKENTIKDISFNVNKGEIFGLLGPSGAGKSTTQKILIKLLNNYKGSILYKDKELSSYKNDYFEEIGVGFEMPILFSKLTASENIKYFKKLYKNNIDTDKLLKRVGLWDDRNKLVSDYSKGMKMRLNFIRAMLNNPELLFLDEVTNGLDPKNARIIKDLILEFKEKGGTVFITTHLMNDVDDLCDRVAFIVDGKIKEISSPRELKLKYGKRIVNIEVNNNTKLIKREFDMNDLGSNKEFLDLIKSNNIETIHSGETTLEDIFIKVTGETINDK